LAPREKTVESVNKGATRREAARRFCTDRAAVKRYCKVLDERSTPEPRMAPEKPRDFCLFRLPYTLFVKGIGYMVVCVEWTCP